MGIFLIIIIILILCWPLIKKWIRQYMARRAEDFLRSATGMPPRPGSKEDRRRQQTSQQPRDDGSYSRRTYRRPYEGRGERNGPIIPPGYAEDVEFVETKDYSETTISESDGKSTRQYHESQVSDAEWIDLN